MVPQDKICTTGGYNSCPPHLNPSTTVLLSYFRVEQDFSHFILFLSSLLSRWASRHHKLQYAFYAASRCFGTPSSSDWSRHTLPLFGFSSSWDSSKEQLQRQRRGSSFPRLDWTQGSSAPGSVATGLLVPGPAVIPSFATPLSLTSYKNYWKCGIKQSKPALPNPESQPSKPLLNLEYILKRHRTKLSLSYSEVKWS